MKHGYLLRGTRLLRGAVGGTLASHLLEVEEVCVWFGDVPHGLVEHTGIR